MRICLYGSGSKEINNEYLEIGYKLGEKIGERNHTLVFGAGSEGMMGSVGRGALKNNSKIIGISPEWMDEFEDIFKECDEFIKTKSMDERKNLFLENSDGFIISPGGIGTLDEFFEIITLKKLKRHNKPIVVFNINNYYDKLIDFFQFMNEEKFLYNGEETFKVCETIEDTIKYLEEY